MKRLRPDENSGNPLDQTFREGLANGEVPPPHGAWANIEAGLDAAQPAAAVAGSNWWYAPVAMLVAFALLINAALLIESNYLQGNNEMQQAGNFAPFQFETGQFAYDENSDFLQMMGLAPALAPETNNAFPFSIFNHKEKEQLAQRLRTSDVSPVNEDLLSGLSVPNAGENDVFNVAAIARKPQNNKHLLSEMAFSREKETAIAPMLTSSSNNLMLESLSPTEDDDSFKGRMAGRKAARELQSKLIPVKGFSVGPTASAHSTLMMLKSNSQSRSLGDDIKYNMDWGTACGVAFGYDFSTRFGVEADFIINSNQGQTFSARQEDGRVNGEIDLKYVQVPVLLKYKWAKLSSRTQKPVALNYIFGLQYSRLKTASITVPGKKYETQNTFSQNEMGITFGFDYDVFMTKNLFLSLGTRGTLSSDINSFPLLINNETQKPYTFLLGINASLKYLLHKS